MKKRKLHQLTGTIQYCFSGQVGSKGPHRNQPFFIIEIITQNLLAQNQTQTIYAFPNLVSSEVWKILERESYQDKKYDFYCEKRVRGWRLKGMEELSN